MGSGVVSEREIFEMAQAFARCAPRANRDDEEGDEEDREAHHREHSLPFFDEDAVEHGYYGLRIADCGLAAVFGAAVSVFVITCSDFPSFCK
jgi:hypothetical protein